MDIINRGFGKFAGVGQGIVAAGAYERVIIGPLNGGRPVTVTVIPLTKLSHGAVTDGPFVVGEIVGDGTLTAMIVDVESDHILVADPSGTFTAGTLTGATSGATATLSAVQQGSGLVRHTTSPDSPAGGVFNLKDGTEIYGDSDDGEVSVHTSRCIISGVTAVKLNAIDVACLFEVVV